MNKLTSFIIATLLLTSLAGLIWRCQTSPNQQATVVANLRCEYLTNPLGIDVARPRFLKWDPEPIGFIPLFRKQPDKTSK